MKTKFFSAIVIRQRIDSNDKRSSQSASKRSCPHTVIIYYVTLCTILHLNVLILQNIVYVEMRLLSPDLFEDLYATRNIDLRSLRVRVANKLDQCRSSDSLTNSGRIPPGWKTGHLTLDVRSIINRIIVHTNVQRSRLLLLRLISRDLRFERVTSVIRKTYSRRVLSLFFFLSFF